MHVNANRNGDLGPPQNNIYTFAAGPQGRWQGASDEHTLRYVRSEQRRQRAGAPQPTGARRRALAP